MGEEEASEESVKFGNERRGLKDKSQEPRGGATTRPVCTQVTKEEKKELRKRETVVLVAVEQTDSQKHQASESGTDETQPKQGHGADAT